MATQGGAVFALIGLIVASVLAACGGPAPVNSGVAASTSGSHPSLPTAGPSNRTPVPTTTCSNTNVVSTWTVARRAAELIVAPVLDFDMASVRIAASAGVGGILFLGNGAPPHDLGQQLRGILPSPQDGGALVMADEEGGGVQRLLGAVPSIPWARVMGQSMTPGQVQDLATTVGRRMKQAGIDVDLAPVVDLDAGPGPSATDPDGSRSFSATPSRAARYGLAFMDGLETAGVLPVLKHFPGLGEASGNTDVGAATTPPLSTLEGAGLLPFRNAIAAGAPAVMVSNATVPGLTSIPASLSPAAMNGLLRTSLRFPGLILTDSLSAGAIGQAGFALPSAAVAAIRAGADMVLFGSTLTAAATLSLSPASLSNTVAQLVGAIVAAVQSGSISTTRLDAAVDHVLAAKGTDLCASR